MRVQARTLCFLSLASLLASPVARGQCSGGGAGTGAVPPVPFTPAPEAPGPAAAGPASPAGPGARPAGGPAGPASPAKPPGPTKTVGGPSTYIEEAIDSTWWALWWEHNKPLYLDLDRLGADLPSTGPMESIDPLASQRRGLSYHDLYEDLVPRLVAQLEQAQDGRLQAELLLALGRIGDAPRREGVEPPAPLGPLLARFLTEANPEVCERAVFALGLLGDANSATILGDLVRDTPAARARLGRGRVSQRMRAQAAHGLGLIAARGPRHLVRYSVHQVSEVLATDEAGPELEAACMAALSLARIDRVGGDEDSPESPSASRSALVALVLEHLKGRNERNPARIHAPTALARLLPGLPQDSELRQEAHRRLNELANPRGKERDEVRRSAVLGLGLVADADDDALDAASREVLQRCVGGSDVTTRGFALVSLGQVAGRKGNAEDPFASSMATAAYLAKQLVRGKNWSKPWAALGIGTLGYGKRQGGDKIEKTVADSLLSELRESKSDLVRPALAIAVGLLRDERGRIELQKQLSQTRNEEEAAALALALGMLNTSEAYVSLRQAQLDAEHFPRMAESVALGRKLCGDNQVQADLLDLLQECDCYGSTLAVSRALAWAGDARAVESLLGVAESNQRPGRVRAAAVIALGWLGDDDRLPADAPYSIGANYANAGSTLTDPMAYGMLDWY